MLIFNIFKQNLSVMKRVKGAEFIEIVASIVTVIIFILAIGSSISGYIRPHHFKWIALTNVILPVTIISSIVLTIFWLIRRSWGFLLPLFSIAINALSLLSFFQIRGNSNPEHSADKSFIKVISYNIREFKHFRGEEAAGGISHFIDEQSPDILCLQEYKNSPYLNDNEMDGLFRSLSEKFIQYPDVNSLGLAIMSKHKIVNRGIIDFESTSNRVIWADLIINDKLVRIVNCHLQSTNVDNNNIRGGGFFKTINKLMESNEMRAAQAEEVRLLVDTTAHPVIVCGDFNDTPSSYTYVKIKGRKLRDGFREAGSKLGGTYRGMMGMFRIDYILHTDDFKSNKYISPDKEWSDHKPVISELEYQN